jgi:hypothetical protein
MDVLYTSSKFASAVQTLATGPGNIKSRLLDVFSYNLYLSSEADLPEHLVEDFVWVKAELTKRKPKVRLRGGCRWPVLDA